MTDGTFVSIEGIDGSGKTSVIRELEIEMDALAITQEPTKTWTGDNLREALSNDALSAWTDLYYFAADRKEHIDAEIRPLLENGRTVVSDRYIDSTRAYQGALLKDEIDNQLRYIDALHDPWLIEPDVTIYLDVSVDTALERCDEDEKYERRDFLREVRDNYRYLEKREGRIKKVDAERHLEDVVASVKSIIQIYQE